jgi:hypothetical protein
MVKFMLGIGRFALLGDVHLATAVTSILQRSRLLRANFALGD